jgi:hypothetical protein
LDYCLSLSFSWFAFAWPGKLFLIEGVENIPFFWLLFSSLSVLTYRKFACDEFGCDKKKSIFNSFYFRFLLVSLKVNRWVSFPFFQYFSMRVTGFLMWYRKEKEKTIAVYYTRKVY